MACDWDAAQARRKGHRKDIILDELGMSYNTAQFVSYDPDLQQTFCRVRGFAPNHPFATFEEAVGALLQASGESAVHVRSFCPYSPKGKPFIMDLTTVDDVKATVTQLATQGLYIIVGERIDVYDGGISGVVMGGVMEFAPWDTPRCVEKPGVCRLPYAAGEQLLSIVYGLPAGSLNFRRIDRVEFSVHPLRRGFKQEHVIVWERERDVGEFPKLAAPPAWPNRFSEFLGDKLFGLLVAYCLGLHVPETHAICRHVRTFHFGYQTMTGDHWIRTCPAVPQPGKLLTQKGWSDPFAVGQSDPAIMATLSQEGVDAAWSGACLIGSDGQLVIEGVPGEGDRFMVGEQLPVALPEDLRQAVEATYRQAERHVGPCRFEWVYDTYHESVWIVQFHVGATEGAGAVIYPGEPENGWITFEPHHGLENLRTIVGCALANRQGIEILGQIGITSHLGDVLRKAQVPARLKEK